MSERSAAIGLASARLRRAAAEELRLVVRNEGPCHGFDEAARRERALGDTRALLQHGEHRLDDLALDARQRRRGHAIEAGDADDLLDEIGLAADIGTPGRGCDLDPFTGTGNVEAEQVRAACISAAAIRGPVRRLTSDQGKSMAAGLSGSSPANSISEASPPHSSITIAVARSKAGPGGNRDRRRARNGSARPS